MKKSILFFALLAFSFVSFAQAKKDSLNKSTVLIKKDTVVKPPAYKINPAKSFVISLDVNTLNLLLSTSKAGVIPFYKTTQTPMSQMDNLDEYYKSIYRDIQAQVGIQIKADRDKFLTDSLKAVKHKK